MNGCRTGLVLLLLSAAAAPGCGSTAVRDAAPSYELTDQSLFLEVDRRDYGIQVGLRDGPVWFGPPDFVPTISVWDEGREVVLPFREAGKVEVLGAGGVGQSKVHIRLSEFPHPAAEAIVVDIAVALIVGKDEFTVEVTPVRDPAGRLFGVDYPPPLVLPSGVEGYTVVPTMHGILIPGDHPEDLSYTTAWWPDPSPDRSEPWWGGAVYTRASTMAWFGAVRGRQGYLGVIDTPHDATIDLRHPPGGPTRIRVRWRPSRGALSYARRIRYSLFREASYLSLARRYREHAMSAGYHRSLREKKGARSIVAEIAGATLLRADFPRVEDPLIVAKAGRAARGKGIEKAILRLPREAPVLTGAAGRDWKGFARGLREDGWLLVAQTDPFGGDPEVAGDRELAVWPSRQGSLQMMVRNRVVLGSTPRERRSRAQPRARAAAFTTWYGGYDREDEVVCPVHRLKTLDADLRETARQGIRIAGVHLMDLSQLPLFDCFHTNHPLDKDGCAEAIGALMRRVAESGHIVCADEPADFAFEVADIFDRGPYPRAEGVAGAPRGVPAPLLSLVYHDAAVIAWDLDTGDDATDREQYLHAALTGGIGALPIDAYGWLTRKRGGEDEEARKDREGVLLDRARTLSAIHEAVWDQAMVSHEFLSPDRRVQRSRFANGVEVRVDFGAGDITLRGVDPF